MPTIADQVTELAADLSGIRASIGTAGIATIPQGMALADWPEAMGETATGTRPIELTDQLKFDLANLRTALNAKGSTITQGMALADWPGVINSAWVPVLQVSAGNNPNLPLGWIQDSGLVVEGIVYNGTATIDLTTATHPAPMSVYQNQRYLVNLTYALAGFNAAQLYKLRFHWAETQAGGRNLAVAVNGVSVISSFDVFVVTGGISRAYSADTDTLHPDSTGAFVIIFSASGTNGFGFINGIEVLQQV